MRDRRGRIYLERCPPIATKEGSMSLSERLQRAAEMRRLGFDPSGDEPAPARALPEIDLRDRPAPAMANLPIWEPPFVDTIDDVRLASVTQLHRNPVHQVEVVNAGGTDARVASLDLRRGDAAEQVNITLESWTERTLSDERARQAQLDSLYEIIAAERVQRGLPGTEPHERRGDTTPFSKIRLAHSAKQATVEERPTSRLAKARPTLADLRHEVKPGASRECPACGAPARIDIHDPVRGRMHLSCNSCYKMWQEHTDAVENAHESITMRD